MFALQGQQPQLRSDSLHISCSESDDSCTVNAAVAQQSCKGEDKWMYEASTELTGVPWHLFVVLDGHQGSKCADYVRKTLWHELLQLLPKTEPKAWEDEDGALFAQNVRIAMVKAFDTVDQGWYAETKPSGTTATVALLTGNFLTIANVGDSSAYLLTRTDHIEMSKNHRVSSSPTEQRRLLSEQVHLAPLDKELKGPAKIGNQGLGPLRVWPGGLAVSRSIGDADVAPQVVSCPYIKQIIIPEDGGRLLLATDGLWDSMPPSRVLQLSRRKRLKKLPEALINTVCRIYGGEVKDDTTIVAIDILPPDHEDFKYIRRSQNRLFSCFSSKSEDERPRLFYELDSITMQSDASKRTSSEFLARNLKPDTEVVVAADYTVHGERKPAVFQLIEASEE